MTLLMYPKLSAEMKAIVACPRSDLFELSRYNVLGGDNIIQVYYSSYRRCKCAYYRNFSYFATFALSTFKSKEN